MSLRSVPEAAISTALRRPPLAPQCIPHDRYSSLEMSSPSWQSAIVPAQLSFLAIYNPSLGPSDETFQDQLVFWYSRAAHEARVNARKNVRNDAAASDASREEENEKLRQIGLAQGMIDFARYVGIYA